MTVPLPAGCGLKAQRQPGSRKNSSAKTVKTKSANKKKSAVETACCVRLELVQPEAQQACIAGSFNDWHPAVTPMVALGDGRWLKELTLPPGRYEYRFVIDGVWACDPNNRKSVSNPFGESNSVLEVS
jgi:1,4-alpha-glucan branching enzyme